MAVNEQSQRFSAIRDLVQQAHEVVTELEDLTNSALNEIDHDSSWQAESLQRIQFSAGRAVQALTEAAELARHARSYQAQQHQRHTGDVPQ